MTKRLFNIRVKEDTTLYFRVENIIVGSSCFSRSFETTVLEEVPNRALLLAFYFHSRAESLARAHCGFMQ